MGATQDTTHHICQLSSPTQPNRRSKTTPTSTRSLTHSLTHSRTHSPLLPSALYYCLALASYCFHLRVLCIATCCCELARSVVELG